MKLKHFILAIVLLLVPSSVLSQIDSTEFYDLKLVCDRLQVYEKREGPDKIKHVKLPNTYFFFTKDGIYGADEFGILIYKFASPVKHIVQPEYGYNKFIVNAIDTDGNVKCKIVVNDYLEREGYRLFIIYKKRQFIFNCAEVE